MTVTYTSMEACEEAGCTYRQLDYWIRNDVFADLESTPGTGHYRKIPGTMIPSIRAVTSVAAALHDGGGLASTHTLAQVAAAGKGRLDLGHGVTLKWRRTK